MISEFRRLRACLHFATICICGCQATDFKIKSATTESRMKDIQRIARTLDRFQVAESPDFLDAFFSEAARSGLITNGEVEIASRDGWGKRFRVQRETSEPKFTLFSAGPDQEFGTSDDIELVVVFPETSKGSGKTPG